MVDFESNLTMQNIDGKLTNKVSLSNFKLKKSTYCRRNTLHLTDMHH